MHIRAALLRNVRRFGSCRLTSLRSVGYRGFQPYVRSGTISQCIRGFSAESEKLRELVQGEIQHENSNYESPANIKTFLEKNDWNFVEKDGDINMTLEKTVDGTLLDLGSLGFDKLVVVSLFARLACHI
uniref:Uncharacterized protein n=1 Tax=Babesia bovis TaxID=5865 RepID=S6C9G3_BABBO|nr:conserved hypothetical protein [Babesia bovis]